jgi:hypothetical protein
MVTIAQDTPDFQPLLFQAFTGEQIANSSLLALCFAQRQTQRGPPGALNRTRRSSAGNFQLPKLGSKVLQVKCADPFSPFQWSEGPVVPRKSDW